MAIKKQLPKLILAFLVITLFYCWRYYAAPRPVAGQLQLHFLDVGQGDATLIQTPENKLILIDGGPDGKVLMSRLSAFFLSGRCRLEAVVLTHPDTDHEAGLLEVLDRCEVKTVIANTATCKSFNCEEFNELTEDTSQGSATLFQDEKRNRKQITDLSGFTGDVFQIGTVALTVLNPPSYQDFNDANTNDDSIVLLLTFGEFRALLTGDAENRTFERILANNRKQIADNKIDLLKVPHHGSANNFDASVWEQLRPEVAVISVGKNNYGHPAPQVLGAATVIGTRVLRTDLQGTINILVSETGLWEIK